MSHNTQGRGRGGGRSRVQRRNRGHEMKAASVTDGVYANARMAYTSALIIGCPVEVVMKNGSCYKGIFKCYSPQMDIVLSMCHQVEEGNPSDVPNKESITDSIVFKPGNIVMLTAKNVDLEYAQKDAFTDSGISKFNGAVPEKELTPWEAGDEQDGTMDIVLEDGAPGAASESNGWNPSEMFHTNETRFNVKSTYDSSLSQYTTTLTKTDSAEFKEREKRAEQKAREIESSESYGRNIALEDGGEDEEKAFSAVQRLSEDTNGIYKPPHLRKNPQDGRAKPLNPSPISNNGSSGKPSSPSPEDSAWQGESPTPSSGAAAAAVATVSIGDMTGAKTPNTASSSAETKKKAAADPKLQELKEFIYSFKLSDNETKKAAAASSSSGSPHTPTSASSATVPADTSAASSSSTKEDAEVPETKSTLNPDAMEFVPAAAKPQIPSFSATMQLLMQEPLPAVTPPRHQSPSTIRPNSYPAPPPMAATPHHHPQQQPTPLFPPGPGGYVPLPGPGVSLQRFPAQTPGTQPTGAAAAPQQPRRAVVSLSQRPDHVVAATGQPLMQNPQPAAAAAYPHYYLTGQGTGFPSGMLMHSGQPSHPPSQAAVAAARMMAPQQTAAMAAAAMHEQQMVQGQQQQQQQQQQPPQPPQGQQGQHIMPFPTVHVPHFAMALQQQQQQQQQQHQQQQQGGASCPQSGHHINHPGLQPTPPLVHSQSGGHIAASGSPQQQPPHPPTSYQQNMAAAAAAVQQQQQQQPPLQPSPHTPTSPAGQPYQPYAAVSMAQMQQMQQQQHQQQVFVGGSGYSSYQHTAHSTQVTHAQHGTHSHLPSGPGPHLMMLPQQPQHMQPAQQQQQQQSAQQHVQLHSGAQNIMMASNQPGSVQYVHPPNLSGGPPMYAAHNQ